MRLISIYGRSDWSRFGGRVTVRELVYVRGVMTNDKNMKGVKRMEGGSSRSNPRNKNLLCEKKKSVCARRD